MGLLRCEVLVILRNLYVFVKLIFGDFLDLELNGIGSGFGFFKPLIGFMRLWKSNFSCRKI